MLQSSQRWRQATGLLMALAIVLSGCKSESDRAAPPRVTSELDMPSQSSTLVVPIALSLDDLQGALEREMPRQLWSIDERHSKCIGGQRVKAFGRRLKVTPDIDCRIVGEVNRGAITLSGSGERLTISMPVRATISARDVGGVLKGETATGSAVMRADVRFVLDRDWNPSAQVAISYDWTEPPGIDFLGKRIEFAEKADAKLAKALAKLETALTAAIARANLRPKLAGAWHEGFAVIRLSRARPPAWMRITPTGMGLAGYAVSGRTVTLTIAAEAIVETFVAAERPDPRAPTPLPPQIAHAGGTGLKFFMPVVADYAQLEPVVLKELRKLAKKGIRLGDVGHIDATFENVTIYATENNRLALGIDAEVEPVGATLGTRWGKAKGRVWLTGVPVNDADSRVIRVEDLEVYGEADRAVTNLLIQVLSSDAVLQSVAGSLEENFEKDYQKVLGKAQRAIGGRQEGNFLLSATIDELHHDRVQVTGAGLFLPVVVTGRGEIRLAPRRRGR